jgi:hypothetical protein
VNDRRAHLLTSVLLQDAVQCQIATRRFETTR